VSSDWREFEKLAATEDPDCWAAALSLVRGRPFDGLRSLDWLTLDGTMAAVEASVVDLACRLARESLDRDPKLAEFAARQALLVSAYDERLYRILLKVADRVGNPAGVESAMSELLHVVADGLEPLDAIHPETLALYRTLSRRGTAQRKAGV
jgi:hypothetical protein